MKTKDNLDNMTAMELKDNELTDVTAGYNVSPPLETADQKINLQAAGSKPSDTISFDNDK